MDAKGKNQELGEKIKRGIGKRRKITTTKMCKKALKINNFGI